MCDTLCEAIVPVTAVTVILLGTCLAIFLWCYLAKHPPKTVTIKKTRTLKHKTPRSAKIIPPELKMDMLRQSILQNTSLKCSEKHLGIKPQEATCIICLLSYHQGTSSVYLGLLKTCGHYFHFDCIWQWLQQHQNCPICRESCELSETCLHGVMFEQMLPHTSAIKACNVMDREEEELL